MSEARALTNVIGNGVACLVIAQWTGETKLNSVRKRLTITQPELVGSRDC
jgi:aerobic C4-dicarboxylate transport protein